MAAYASLVSVMQILHQIENHPFPPISLDKQQVESLTQIVTFLQEFLEGYISPMADTDEADPLEMRIADAAYAAEDVIESHIVDNIKLVAETIHGDDDDDADSNKADRIPFPESRWKKLGFFNCFRKPKNDDYACYSNNNDESNIVDNVKLVAQTTEDNELNIVDQILPSGSESQKEPKNYGEKISSVDLYEGLKKAIEDMDLIKKDVMEIVAKNEVVQDQLQRQVSSASASLTRLNSTMVGFDDVRLEIMDKLTDGRLNRHVISIVGMGGIGKTTLAKNIYAQKLIKEHFDICAWTTISQKYNTKQILCDLLSQVNKEGSEDEVGEALYKYLYGRRFLIVLDDIWGFEAWDEMKHSFPDNGNSSRILVTTRLSDLGSQLEKSNCLKMKFLDNDSSWKLFTKTVFGEGSCPLELELIGKKIVESCRGLPLSIVVIGGLLEKLERSKKCWESIRRNLNSVVNSENDEHCLKILKMSYNHLPVYLKPCFLYMGVFEEDSAIQVSNVIKIWISEGFLKPKSDESLETIAKGYIKELADRNLILVGLGSTGSVKYCRIHDLLRDLCLKESQKERFYHVVGQQNPQSTGSKRCIVIQRGSSKKKVLNAIRSTPCARSYISDHERVRLLPNLRLLRTLKAYKRGYPYQRHRYPLEKMFQSINLRFLAVTAERCSKLPSSINLLWSIQTLIVHHPEENVNACVEIWKMPQLRHVQFYKLHLPDPPRDNIVIMDNLQTLIGITDFKCDEEVVRRIPNIKKLGITYYFKGKGSESNDDHYCLHNIECLNKLESFSCVCHRESDCLKKLSFPRSLKKLNLMMNDDLEDMLAKIGWLPLLEKLILYGGRSRTDTWEVVEGQFPKLKFLSLEWFLGLEIWTMESSSFPCLERLHLHALHTLKEIPTEIGEIPRLESIVLDRCSASAVKSMKNIVEEQQELQGDDLPFKVQVVLFGENEELQKVANHNFQVTIPHLIPIPLDDHFCNCLI